MVDYVTTMMHKAMDESTKRGKLATEDLVYLVRKVSIKIRGARLSVLWTRTHA